MFPDKITQADFVKGSHFYSLVSSISQINCSGCPVEFTDNGHDGHFVVDNEQGSIWGFMWKDCILTGLVFDKNSTRNQLAMDEYDEESYLATAYVKSAPERCNKLFESLLVKMQSIQGFVNEDYATTAGMWMIDDQIGLAEDVSTAIEHGLDHLSWLWAERKDLYSNFSLNQLSINCIESLWKKIGNGKSIKISNQEWSALIFSENQDPISSELIGIIKNDLAHFDIAVPVLTQKS